MTFTEALLTHTPFEVAEGDAVHVSDPPERVVVKRGDTQADQNGFHQG